MNRSNYTLRFPRTYREATGMDAHFERPDWDRLVGFVGAAALLFVLGFLAGSWA